MDDKTTALISIRIDPLLKTAFERVGRDLDLTPSQMLRQYIRKIVEQHASANAQGDLNLEPEQTPRPATKKPAKGQKMASMKPANWKKP